MLKFGKQLLELASENAKIKEEYDYNKDELHKIINKQTILDTIKEVE